VHDKQVRRRRAVLALLVGVSLILLTAYFGESPSSPLHNVQRGIVEVVSRYSREPAPSCPGQGRGRLVLGHAPGQVAERPVARAAEQGHKALAYYEQKATLTSQLEAQLKLDDTNSISSYQPVSADVIGADPTLWYQTIEIDQGSDDGITMNDPVTGSGALVGKVTELGSSFSIVTTDHRPYLRGHRRGARRHR